MKVRRISAGVALGAVAVALFVLYFHEALFGGRVYYPGDAARAYLPLRAALVRAWAQGQAPWWVSTLGAGYPLLAEGEIGAFYLPNWILYRLLPLEVALNASILLHYAVAGLGFYAYMRTLKLSYGAAFLGSLLFSLGGFNIAHLSHLTILSVVAWLPWLFTLTRRLLGDGELLQRQCWGTALALAAVVALQFLAGHAQISLLSLVPLAAYALWLGWPRGGAFRRVCPGWALWGGALVLGTLLALPQLWPSYELARLSGRGGGLSHALFVSFSFEPRLLVTYLSPFWLGNPYPEGSVETMAYVGVLPLVLTGVALVYARPRERWFFAGLAVIGVLLAFGGWNPFYAYLRYVPVLNLFRVPARYLCWTSLSLAVLAAWGLDVLARRTPARILRRALLGLGLVGLALSAGLVGVLRAGTVEEWLVLWRWLPLALVLGALGLVLAARYTSRRVWLALACALLFMDLYAYGGVLQRTYNTTLPRAEVMHPPASLTFFQQDQGLYRLYTKEEILPVLPVMRESFYPNFALTYDLASANLSMPLVPRNYSAYLEALDARRLNALNVKYYLIPQLLPVDEASELYDVQNPFASLPVNTWLEVPELELESLTVESYLSHAADLPDGELAAELVLRDTAGQEQIIPLRVGLETAEWAYERDDVAATIVHSLPEIATTWPSRSGFPPREHPGHTYLTRRTFAQPVRVQAILLRPRLPEAFVRIERVRLRETSGREQLLAHLIGLGDHTIVYRSEDVVVYRNEDVLPRAYTLPGTAATREGAALRLPKDLSVAQVGPVDVVAYADQQVTLRARLDAPGYLVLADLFYPGWRATVDGVEAPILAAEGVFRAVALDPGEHEVMFRYHPWPSR